MRSDIEVAQRALLDAVNNARTENERAIALARLGGWRDGITLALRWEGSERGLLLMEGDMYYLDQPEHEHRPMCGGIWLDWEAT